MAQHIAYIWKVSEIKVRHPLNYCYIRNGFFIFDLGIFVTSFFVVVVIEIGIYKIPLLAKNKYFNSVSLGRKVNWKVLYLIIK